MTDLIDSEKGKAVSGTRRTICEAVRDLYDKCVLGLHETNPELLEQLRPNIEEIFRMGIKMNRRLLEHNIKAIDYYDEDVIDVEARQKQREYRASLVDMLDDNLAKGIHEP